MEREYSMAYNTTMPIVWQLGYLIHRDPKLSVLALQQVWLFLIIELYCKSITRILPTYVTFRYLSNICRLCY